VWVRIGAGLGAVPCEGWGASGDARTDIEALPQGRVNDITKSLILAQNERWRRVLSMQVEREPSRKGRGEWRTGE
jgi:hypothetical protein